MFNCIYVDNCTSVEVIGEAKSESGVEFIQVKIDNRKKGWVVSESQNTSPLPTPQRLRLESVVSNDHILLPPHVRRIGSYVEADAESRENESDILG